MRNLPAGPRIGFPTAALLLLLVLLVLGGRPAGAQSPAASPTTTAPPARSVLTLEIDGAIGPATADYLHRGLAEAARREVGAVLLTIDTPGGLDTSMRAMIRDILASPVPVLAYVHPGGARAASAGTYLLYASHVAAMSPGTHLGAATPVTLGGGFPRPDGGGRPGDDPKRPGAADDADPPPKRGPGAAREPASAGEAKAINDAVGYIRTLAELRGRNADWGESAVREAATLPASGALSGGVIDLIAVDVDDLLRQADGRQVALGKGTATLATAGATTLSFPPDWRTKLLGIITNPNIALLLMLIGFYGLLFEFMNPGALVPGTIGGISLLLGLFSLAVLPIDTTGAALVLLGMMLLVAEAFVPSFGILGLGGVVAVVFGLAMLLDTEGVPGFEIAWPVIGGVAAAMVLFVMIAARLALRARRHPHSTGPEAMVGAVAQIIDWNGAAGHVHIHGERWNATAGQPLLAGQRVRVLSLDGLTLDVAPLDPSPPSGVPAQ